MLSYLFVVNVTSGTDGRLHECRHLLQRHTCFPLEQTSAELRNPAVRATHDTFFHAKWGIANALKKERENRKRFTLTVLYH